MFDDVPLKHLGCNRLKRWTILAYQVHQKDISDSVQSTRTPCRVVTITNRQVYIGRGGTYFLRLTWLDEWASSEMICMCMCNGSLPLRPTRSLTHLGSSFCLARLSVQASRRTVTQRPHQEGMQGLLICVCRLRCILICTSTTAVRESEALIWRALFDIPGEGKRRGVMGFHTAEPLS